MVLVKDQTEKLGIQTLTIKPRVVFSKKKKDTIETGSHWEETKHLLREISKSEYSAFMNEIDSSRQSFPKLFFSHLKKAIKYKGAKKLVTVIAKNGIAQTPEQSNYTIDEFFHNLLYSDRLRYRRLIFDDSEECSFDFERTLEQLSYGKAVGCDHISAEWIVKG